jgi:L-cysteine S-thiosulfotransferase
VLIRLAGLRAGMRLALLGLLAVAFAAQAADRMDTPLTGTAGDAARGERIFASRDGGHCVLCHAVPGAAQAGNVGPSLAGVGKRLDAGQLRLRIVDITQVSPDAVMPAFHRTQGLNRVVAERAGKTLLSAQQVEDLVAYLSTLK